MKLLAFALLMSSPTFAQTTSRTYRLMLQTLYKETVPFISCEELKKQSGLVLLDTRARREYEVSHLPNARWVGYEEFEPGRVKDVPKNAAIVVYCSVGYRSERIGEKLTAAGYTNVRNLYGSLFEWVNQGNAVVDSQGRPTKKVHAYSRAWGIWLKQGEKVYE